MAPWPIVAGSASRRLARELAEEIQAPLAEVEIKDFPDGEVYVRIASELAGRDVVVLNTTYPNARLVELMLLQAGARNGGAGRIVTVAPYYAYSRQDMAFKPGEVVSAEVLARHFSLDSDAFATVDPHKEHILKFMKGARSVSAVPEIAERLRLDGVDLVLAPDKGARDRAEAAAHALGVPHDHLEKTRISGTEVRMAPKELRVEGKVVAIIDDIISTGGTIATAAGELKRMGARRVIAACTHGLFLSGAIERMKAGGVDHVLATDTIESAASEVSAAKAVARALR